MAYTSFVIATNPPVAYYRLDESSGPTAIDASENNRDATYNGTPTLQQSSAISEPNTYSVLFNGSSDYIDIGTQIDTAITNIFSLSLYVKFTALPIDTEVFTLIDCHNRFELLALKSGTDEGIYIYLPGIHTLVTDAPFIPLASLNTSNFFNVAVTYDQVNLKIFLNGKLIDSEVQTGTLQVAGGNGTFIAVDNTGGANYWSGGLDEVGIFNSVIADRAIALNYYALDGEKYYRAATLSMFPKVYFMLDEESGSTVTDKTDNSFDGTYVGSPILGSNGKIVTGVAFAPLNSDYIDIGLPLGSGSGGNKTIAFYVNPDNFTNQQYLIANKHDGSSGISIVLNTDATIGISWGNGENVVQTVNTIVNTEFTLITVTMNAFDNVGKIYLNEKEEASGDLGTEQSNTNKIRASGQWLTSDSGSDSLFEGNLDEISIYDKVLSYDEVVYLYHYGFIEYPFYDFLVLQKNPFAYWNFSEASGDIIDQSGNNQDLTVSVGSFFNYQQPAFTNADDNNYSVYFSGGYFAAPSYIIPTDGGGGNDWTYESWVTTGTMPTGLGCTLMATSTSDSYFSLVLNNGKLQLRRPTYHTFNFTFQPYTVYHIVVMRHWNGVDVDGILYINGVHQETMTIMDNIPQSGGITYFFQNNIDWRADYLTLYDRPLTASEIRTLYNAGKYGFGYNAQLNGAVYDDTGTGTPLDSKIRVSNAATGAFVKDEQNNPATGDFQVDFDNFDEVYLQSIPADVLRRSKVHGPLVPEVI